MPLTHRPIRACELKNKVGAALVALLVLSLGAAAHQPDQPVPNPQGAAQAPVAAETAEDAHEAAQGEAAHAAEEHGMWGSLLWPTVNFAILAGGLWWLLKDPFARHLQERHAAIRRDLVEAAEVKAAATAQLDELDRKLRALPGEIEALRQRGHEEIAAEEQRIAAAAAAERDRLLEQTRREIELQVRLAKRELVEHAADLAVQLAGTRLEQQITSADQQHLVDRYLDQVSRRRGGPTP